MSRTSAPTSSSGGLEGNNSYQMEPVGATQKVTIQLTSNPEDLIDIINENETNNYKLGVILLLLAIATWILGLELVNSVLKGDDYNHSIFLAYMIGSCFSLFLIPDIYKWVVNKIFGGSEDQGSQQEDELTQLQPSGLSQHSSKEDILESNLKNEGPVLLTNKEVIGLAAGIAVIYFLYNLMVMTSLQYTSASNQTVIGTVTSIFTLFIGAYLKTDKFTAKKTICSVVSITGVFLINSSNSGTRSNDGNKYIPKNPKLGNTFALLGAFCYALYLIVLEYKYEFGKKTTDERKLFGYVGLITLIGGIPVLFAVDILGQEKFALPPTKNKVLLMILLNSLFSAASDYFTILASLLTSPLITSLSLTGAIPLIILIDYVRVLLSGSETSSFGVFYFIGISSILFSVVLININLTSENELIEEVIENALDEAIDGDEFLSPIFTPLMRPNTNSNDVSPFMTPKSNHNVGVSKSTLVSAFSPRLGVSRKISASGKNVPALNLNQEDSTEGSSKFNSRHNNLYSVENSTSETEEQEASNAVVYSRRGHKYRFLALGPVTSENSHLNREIR